MVNIILLVVFAVVIAGAFINHFLRQRAKRKKSAHAVTVAVDDIQFTITTAEERISVPWADIIRVTIITTSHGPWLDDLFYHVGHTAGDVTLPSEANGMPAFVEMLERLPGFDRAAYTRAIRSVQNDSFVVILRNEEPVV